MNQEIKIRPAIVNDAQQLASLAIRGIPGYPFESIYDPEALAEAIRGGENRIVAIDKDEVILGTAVLGEGYMAEIKRVLVDPEQRKRKLGVELTSTLKDLAQKKGVIPWADVRADQIGMQKAAHRYYPILTPISVEMGKHVVYVHNHDTGPARESMVHMTGHPLGRDTESLKKSLTKWSTRQTDQLVGKMLDSLVTHDKNRGLVEETLPSAQLVKDRIEQNLTLSGLNYNQLTPDVLSLSDNGSGCIVITPDASGFVEGKDASSIARMVDTALSIGLQIVTCYLAITDLSTINYLVDHTGMEPTMVRPWQNTAQTKPEWQVGLRKTADSYHSSLHSINLDPWVYAGVMHIIKSIDDTRYQKHEGGGCF